MSGQREDGKKIVVDTPLVKRKLDLEKEREKKKANKLTTASSSEVEAEEKGEEIEEKEEEDSVINIKKMTPKQLMKVLEKLKLQAEKAKLRANKKKTKILKIAKTIMSDLIPDIVVDDNASIIVQLGSLVKAIVSKVTDLEKVAVRQYETRKGEKLMEHISIGKFALSTSTKEVKSILQEVGQLLVKSSSFINLIKDIEDKRAHTQREIQDLIGSFDPLTSSVVTFSGKVKQLTHKIKKLKEEEDK